MPPRRSERRQRKNSSDLRVRKFLNSLLTIARQLMCALVKDFYGRGGMTIVFLIISFISSLAISDPSGPFEVTKDGYVYQCTVKTTSGSTGAVDCANKAYAGPFNKEESIQLCRGATSTAPADCAILANRGPFSRSEAVELCSFAISEGPAICAKKANAGPFSRADSISLCAGRGTEATADCAIKAYNGPYSKTESIALCGPIAEFTQPVNR